MNRHLPRGFTLVELLTVIAVVGLLSAILVPAIGGARKKARNAACVQNMRQLGAAFFLYAADNGQTLPPNQRNDLPGKETWIDWVYPYAVQLETKGGWSNVNKLFKCPEWVAMKKASGSYQGYGKNYRLAAPYTSANPMASDTTARETPLYLANVPAPGQKILLMDFNDFNVDFQKYMNIPSFLARGVNGPTRHGGAANYLFMDGSVRALSGTEEAIKPYLY